MAYDIKDREGNQKSSQTIGLNALLVTSIFFYVLYMAIVTFAYAPDSAVGITDAGR